MLTTEASWICCGGSKVDEPLVPRNWHPCRSWTIFWNLAIGNHFQSWVFLDLEYLNLNSMFEGKKYTYKYIYIYIIHTYCACFFFHTRKHYTLSISKSRMSTRSTHMVRFLRPPYLQRRRLEATLHPATTRRFGAEVFEWNLESLQSLHVCQAMDNVRVAASYVHGGKKRLGFPKSFLSRRESCDVDVMCDVC